MSDYFLLMLLLIHFPYFIGGFDLVRIWIVCGGELVKDY